MQCDINRKVFVVSDEEGYEMETELKYSIDDERIIQSIMEDRMLTSIEKKDSRETMAMHAVYFDTAESDFQKNHIAFRIRREGSRYIATLKRRGIASDGLHRREEINAPVTEDDFIANPKLSLFAGDELIGDIASEIANKELIPVMEMNFAREKFRVDYRGTIMEISVDQGDIVTAGGSCPICEMEIELYSGSEADLVKLGKQIQKSYNLKAENTSKYGRGLALLGDQKADFPV